MPTRNVVITDHQSQLVDRLVAEGRYQNASELLREGLRLVEAREAAVRRILAGIQEGLDQIERGEVMPLEEAFDLAFDRALSRPLP